MRSLFPDFSGGTLEGAQCHCRVLHILGEEMLLADTKPLLPEEQGVLVGVHKGKLVRGSPLKACCNKKIPPIAMVVPNHL